MDANRQDGGYCGLCGTRFVNFHSCTKETIPLTPNTDMKWVPYAQAQALREERDRLLLQNTEMLELLQQADDLYTGYGLICGPIKDFPKYEGKVHQGVWIGKVRAIVRNSEKRKCALCESEAIGKVGAEPRCERHV